MRVYTNKQGSRNVSTCTLNTDIINSFVISIKTSVWRILEDYGSADFVK
jgi:hypothetical protein